MPAKRHYLLPHAGNIVSIAYLILFIIVRWGLMRFLPEQLPSWVAIINTIALVIACFSAEKQEDEMISHLRLRSVFIVALVYFSSAIVSVFITGRVDTGFLRLFLQVQSDPSLWVLAYLVVFKLAIFWVSRRSADEE